MVTISIALNNYQTDFIKQQRDKAYTRYDPPATESELAMWDSIWEAIQDKMYIKNHF